MYKAILCDDNEIILEGIRTQLDWELLGIELVGCAANGLEALSLVKKYVPDILITDIRMPFLDGLELTRESKKINPDIVTVIISAYNDFEYLRSALKIGAVDYILKPIDIKELTGILTQSVKVCGRNRANKLTNIKGLLELLSHGNISCEEAENACKEAGISIDMFCCVMRLEFIKGSEFKDKLKLFSKLMHELNAYVTEKREGFLTVIICENTAEEAQAKRAGITRISREEIFKENGVYIFSGSVHKGLNNCIKSYGECENAKGLKFTEDTKDIFYDKIIKTDNNTGKINTDILFDIDFVSPLKRQDKEMLEKRIEDLKRELKKSGTKEYITLLIGDIYSRLARELGETGIDLADIFENPLEEFKKISESTSLKEAIEALTEILLNIYAYISRHKSRYAKIIGASMQYIKENYKSPKMSIEDVAAAGFLSPGHFSTVFKNEVGMTFTDYLIGLRMEKAKELLLNTTDKIYEISQKIGYDNAAYFSSAFKKYTGKSPQEFRINGSTLQL